MVTRGGFEAPMDAVVSPDGMTMYFSAYDMDGQAAIFSVATSGGNPQVLFAGAPLEDPGGLLLSCDGDTLLIADLGFRTGDDADSTAAAIQTLDVAGGQLAALSTSGIGEAASLAFDDDCVALYATGYTPEGVPALFELAPTGGSATVVKSGPPLSSPSGVYVDRDHVAWVMDHRPDDPAGGALFAIDPDGTVTEVVGGLALSEPAGVSLTQAGNIAVIPSRDADGDGQLITVELDTGDQTIVSAPEMAEPAGIRTSIGMPVMAVVDADGNAIYRAE